MNSVVKTVEEEYKVYAKGRIVDLRNNEETPVSETTQQGMNLFEDFTNHAFGGKTNEGNYYGHASRPSFFVRDTTLLKISLPGYTVTSKLGCCEPLGQARCP